MAGSDVVRREQDQLSEQLARVARLAIVAEMASAMAHEINQPLAAIATYAAALQRLIGPSVESLDEARGVARQIAAQALRAGNIVHRVRELVKHSEFELRGTSCNESVRDLLMLAEPLANAHRIAISLELADGLPIIYADPLQLQLLLLNVVHNAIDAIESHQPQDRRITIGSRPHPPADVEIWIADTGGGIPDSILEQLFRPFVTTKPHGTGLGLLACQRIARAQGGEFGFENRLGFGARFHVRIPRIAPLNGDPQYA